MSATKQTTKAVPNAPKRGKAKGPRPKHVPQRTCIACRTVRAKPELIRLVRDEQGTVRMDREGRATGRGAYACPTVECLERALQAGKLAHAFKRPSRPPHESPATMRARRTRR